MTMLHGAPAFTSHGFTIRKRSLELQTWILVEGGETTANSDDAIHEDVNQ
jgi:hypothetical protein